MLALILIMWNNWKYSANVLNAETLWIGDQRPRVTACTYVDLRKLPITLTCRVPIRLTYKVPIRLTYKVPIRLTSKVPIRLTCKFPIILTCKVPIKLTCSGTVTPRI